MLQQKRPPEAGPEAFLIQKRYKF